MIKCYEGATVTSSLILIKAIYRLLRGGATVVSTSEINTAFNLSR